MAKRHSAKSELNQEHGMGRFRPELVDRVDDFSNRILDVTDVLERQRRSGRIIDQIIGSGTAVGANGAEADEALSRADFSKTLGIVLKEINEVRFWLRLIARRTWIKPARLAPLQTEAAEPKKIFGAMLTRTRRNTPQPLARSRSRLA